MREEVPVSNRDFRWNSNTEPQNRNHVELNVLTCCRKLGSWSFDQKPMERHSFQVLMTFSKGKMGGVLAAQPSWQHSAEKS